MTATSDELESRLAQFVEHHVLHGERLHADDLCRDHPELEVPLRALIDQYLSLTRSLEAPGDPLLPEGSPGELPSFDGFQTIERIGAGGMGEVFKLRDLKLDRIVAAKVLRSDRQHGMNAPIHNFLREAKALALFTDRRIVQIYECRVERDPAVIIMEFVDGFELGRVGPSLEFAQRAKIVLEICDAVHHAHELGLQHRDLKPSNIMLDASCRRGSSISVSAPATPIAVTSSARSPTWRPNNSMPRAASTLEPTSTRWG